MTFHDDEAVNYCSLCGSGDRLENSDIKMCSEADLVTLAQRLRRMWTVLHRDNSLSWATFKDIVRHHLKIQHVGSRWPWPLTSGHQMESVHQQTLCMGCMFSETTQRHGASSRGCRRCRFMETLLNHGNSGACPTNMAAFQLTEVTQWADPKWELIS